MKLVRTFAAVLAVAGIAACGTSPTLPSAAVKAPEGPRLDLTLPTDSLTSNPTDVPPIVVDLPPPDTVVTRTQHGSGA